MQCNVLKHYHFVVGVDFHKAQPPGPVPPVPYAPHAVTPTPLCLGPWGFLTGKPARSVISGQGGITMQKGTDIGPLIPHICIPVPPNLLTPIIILGSASKSYFGSSTTSAEKAPVAVALLQVVNINLDCGDIPSPTGIVVTFNTVVANFTFADFMSGLATMLVEGVIQAFLNLIFAKGPLADALEGLTGKIFGPIASQFADEMAKGAVGMVASLLIGSPLGTSGSNIIAAVAKAFGATSPDDPNSVLGSGVLSPVGAGAGDASGDAGDAVQKHFDNADQHGGGGADPGSGNSSGGSGGGTGGSGTGSSASSGGGSGGGSAGPQDGGTGGSSGGGPQDAGAPEGGAPEGGAPDGGAPGGAPG
jgi:hypothetical protein